MNETYLFLEIWVSTNKFIIDIAGQILEARHWKGSKLLASLVSLWMKFIADREKGDYAAGELDVRGERTKKGKTDLGYHPNSFFVLSVHRRHP